MSTQLAGLVARQPAATGDAGDKEFIELSDAGLPVGQLLGGDLGPRRAGPFQVAGLHDVNFDSFLGGHRGPIRRRRRPRRLLSAAALTTPVIWKRCLLKKTFASPTMLATFKSQTTNGKRIFFNLIFVFIQNMLCNLKLLFRTVLILLVYIYKKKRNLVSTFVNTKNFKFKYMQIYFKKF
jgi:hypothetical protein